MRERGRREKKKERRGGREEIECLGGMNRETGHKGREREV